MLGQSMAIVSGIGVVGLVAYYEYCARGGYGWILGAVLTSGLFLTMTLTTLPAFS